MNGSDADPVPDKSKRVESVAGRSADLTLPAALASRATTDPDDVFLIHGDESVTFGQLETRAEVLAASLQGLGIEPGDRVAVVMPSWPEFVISMFAVAKLGAVLVPLNPRLTADDLRYTLRHSEAVVAITAETLGDVDFLQPFEELLVQLPDLQYLITVGKEDLWYDDRVFQFEDLLSAGGGRDYSATSPPSAGELFAIVYTAGTTGKPKGVELTHANLLQVAGSTADALGLRPDDRVVGIMALFHVFGLGPGILGSLLSGAALVLQDEFGQAGALDLVERQRATVHYGVPTLFVSELGEQTKAPRDLGSLRRGLVAGAPVSDELVKAVQEKICPELLIAYSLTETSSTVCVTRPDDPQLKRIFTVGRPSRATSSESWTRMEPSCPWRAWARSRSAVQGSCAGITGNRGRHPIRSTRMDTFLQVTWGWRTRRASFIWLAERKRLSFEVVQTYTPGRLRIDFNRTRRYARPWWLESRTSFWETPSARASSRRRVPS